MLRIRIRFSYFHSLRFRWVFCQLENLRHCLPPSVRRILAELPETLDETYKRILSEIPRSNQVHTHRLLQCLTVAVRPLYVEELAEVLAVDFGGTGGIPKLKEDLRWEDQEQAVMSACSSLIAVIEDEDSRVVQISHFSVKEFLTSDRLATSKVDGSCYHHILLEPAHTVMAQACLGVLLRLDYDIDEEKITSLPLAGYAAENFIDHVEFGNVLSHIGDCVDHFLDEDKPHLAAWIWMRRGQYGHPQQPKAVPLYYIAEFGYVGLVRHLISEGPEGVNARRDRGTPLHAASCKGHVEIIQLLLGHCVGVDPRDSDGQTPLHLAAELGSLEVIRILVERNADINAQDNQGRTPLHRALGYNDLGFDVAKFLLEHGADAGVKDNDALSTPLHEVAYRGSVKIVQLLLEHGANVHARNNMGHTPLHRAVYDLSPDNSYEETCLRVIMLLLEHGADIGALDNDHSTPLHVLSLYGNVKATQLLLEQGANVNLQNKESKAPHQIASAAGHEKLVRLLSEHLDNEEKT